MTVDTLGLVLRVLVTATSVGESEAGKQVLKQIHFYGQKGFSLDDYSQGENGEGDYQGAFIAQELWS